MLSENLLMISKIVGLLWFIKDPRVTVAGPNIVDCVHFDLPAVNPDLGDQEEQDSNQMQFNPKQPCLFRAYQGEHLSMRCLF